MTDKDDKDFQKEIEKLDKELDELEAEDISADLDVAIKDSVNLRTSIEDAEKEVEKGIAEEAKDIVKDIDELEKLAEKIDTESN